MRLRGLLGSVLALALAALGLAACGPTVATLAPSATPVAIASPGPSGTTAAPSSAPSPTAATGFEFDAESVAGYYVTQGFTCAGPQPSSLAAGYAVTQCQLVDPAGRLLVVGLVTDPADELADAYASVRGASTEEVLDPAVALDHLAGFLGAMLGSARGEALLPWLAGHIGDDFSTTSVGDLQMATYIKDADHSTLYLELANQGYLDTPAPSTSPS